VHKLFEENLKGASILPFVGFLAPDGKWVTGYSGYKDKEAFAKVLERAENAPYLQASDAVRKKLAGMVTRAGAAAEKGDWKTVVRTVNDAARSHGRCPERAQIAEIRKKAQAWAEGEFDAAIKLSRSAESIDDARAKLMEVRKQLTGEPEAEEADQGVKALQRLVWITKIKSADDATKVRAEAAREYEGTRWTAMFEEAAD